MINSKINQNNANPGWRFVFEHPAHFCAFSGGIGLIRFAPGTFGTLIALPLYWLIAPYLQPLSFLLLIGVMFFLGIWACEKTGQHLGVTDHGGIVWDESVAYLLILFFIPTTTLSQLVGFLIFRFFDIVKLQPIRYIDQRIKNGFGVMLDDLVAALFTLLCFAAMKLAGLHFS